MIATRRLSFRLKVLAFYSDPRSDTKIFNFPFRLPGLDEKYSCAINHSSSLCMSEFGHFSAVSQYLDCVADVTYRR